MSAVAGAGDSNYERDSDEKAFRDCIDVRIFLLPACSGG